MDAKKRKLQDTDADDLITSEDVRSLMEPFSKEQLVELLQEAAMNHADILHQIRELADKDPSHRKLFVHGLGWETSSDAVKAAFTPYGELEECLIIADKKTGKCKGYGFVTFKHRDGAQRALKESTKNIDGRKCFFQLASAGPATVQQQLAQAASAGARKIYVANVPRDFPAGKLVAAFSKFGEIEDGPLGFDKQTGKSKGYALFIYKSVDSVKRVLEEPVKNIDGHQMACKLADGQKQKLAALDMQAASSGIINGNAISDLLPMNQGILGQHSALAAQGLLSGITPTPNLAGYNASFYSSLGPAIAQQLAFSSSLDSSLNTALTPSLSAQLNGPFTAGAAQNLPQHAYGQVPSSLTTPYGASSLSVLRTQVAGLGGTSGLDPSLYGLSTASQPGLLHSSGVPGAAGSRLYSLSSFYGAQ